MFNKGPEISQQLTLENTQAARLMLNVETLVKTMDEVKEVVNKLRHSVVDLNSKVMLLEQTHSHQGEKIGKMEAILQSQKEEIEELKMAPGRRASENQTRIIVGLVSAVLTGIVALVIAQIFPTGGT